MVATVPSSKRRLFIIGASSFGREIEGWLERVPAEHRDWAIAGYLDDNPETRGVVDFPSDYELLGTIDDTEFYDSDLCVIAIAEPKFKRSVVQKLKGQVGFLTFISPDAIVGKFNTFGEGAVVCPGTIVTTNVSVGDFVTINNSCNVGHDVAIGEYSSLMGSVTLSGGVQLGDDVYVGSKATITPSMNIASGSKVGAGSVVIRNVRKPSVVFGNPAKVIKSV